MLAFLGQRLLPLTIWLLAHVACYLKVLLSVFPFDAMALSCLDLIDVTVKELSRLLRVKVPTALNRPSCLPPLVNFIQHHSLAIPAKFVKCRVVTLASLFAKVVEQEDTFELFGELLIVFLHTFGADLPSRVLKCIVRAYERRVELDPKQICRRES